MSTLLEVKNLCTYFETQRGTVRAVDGVDFTLNEGDTLGVVGESGCGKTVLALSIMRLVPPPGRIVSGVPTAQNTSPPIYMAQTSPIAAPSGTDASVLCRIFDSSDIKYLYVRSN